LIANEQDPILKSMHAYFSNRVPSYQNEKTGLFKDYNLIVITAETFSRWAVREDTTPTLYKLIHEGYYFTNYYTPLYTVSTLDAEYMGFTSLLPKSGVWSLRTSSVNDMSFVLGHQMKALGYTTFAFHNNNYKYYHREESHPNLGYTYMGVGNGLTNTGEWPQSDLSMMKETIPMYINEDKFHIYYMTVSGHSNYYWTANAQAAKNQDLVKDLPYIEYAKGYLAAQIELDKSIAYLLDELEKAGKLDQTLIVLTGDHYPYNFFEDTLTNINDGVKVDMEFDVYRSPLIIYNPNIVSETITKSVSSLDLLPTIANLMGISFDSRLMMGADIFSTTVPLVIFKDHSFITPLGKYNAVTKTFIYNDGVTEDADYVKRMIEVVNTKFYYSQTFLENDYYRIIAEALGN
jgi:lipoteichoic acid synthase